MKKENPKKREKERKARIRAAVEDFYRRSDMTKNSKKRPKDTMLF